MCLLPPRPYLRPCMLAGSPAARHAAPPAALPLFTCSAAALDPPPAPCCPLHLCSVPAEHPVSRQAALAAVPPVALRSHRPAAAGSNVRRAWAGGAGDGAAGVEVRGVGVGGSRCAAGRMRESELRPRVNMGPHPTPHHLPTPPHPPAPHTHPNHPPIHTLGAPGNIASCGDAVLLSALCSTAPVLLQPHRHVTRWPQLPGGPWAFPASKLTALAAPTIVIAAERDCIFSGAAAVAAAQAGLADCEAVLLRGAKHVPAPAVMLDLTGRVHRFFVARGLVLQEE